MFQARFALAIVAALMVSGPAQAQDYRGAYTYSLRCFVVTTAVKDQAGAKRAFDAALKLGRLQNLTNRQINADLDRSTATELVRITRDGRYKAKLLSECRQLGFAS